MSMITNPNFPTAQALDGTETLTVRQSATDVQLSVDSLRSQLDGMLLPVYPSTLVRSQTIASGYMGLVYGPITIPASITLTINGQLYITNPILGA